MFESDTQATKQGDMVARSKQWKGGQFPGDLPQDLSFKSRAVPSRRDVT